MTLQDRKPTRLKGYDYSMPGAYFVTICTKDRKCLFDMQKDTVGNAPCGVPSLQNKIIVEWLRKTETKFSFKIDKFVIMPNHIHVIIIISERHPGRSLQDGIRWFKTMVTNSYIKEVKCGNLPPFEGKLWQKSFHDHIIRGHEDYKKIWQYIDTNTLKWELDCLYNATP